MTHADHSPAPLSWRRLAGASTVVALVACLLAAASGTAAAIVTGRLADHPGWPGFALLAACAVAALGLQTGAAVAISGVVGRAEGRLRADLLGVALREPLPVLQEQGVGELVDRLDDDPAQLATLARGPAWWTVSSLMVALLAWLVAGATWWPAWIAFPLLGVVVFRQVHRRSAAVADRKRTEEAAWSQLAAHLEEGVAARDDIRTALGQPYVVRRYVAATRRLLDAVAATARVSSAVTVRAGLALNVLLAAVATGGVALVLAGLLPVASLVTLWLLASGFVGVLTDVAGQAGQLQAGLGALHRVRGLLDSPQEPSGGAAFPPGVPEVEWRGLTFAHPGGFALRNLSLTVPAGTTCALVGRTGAGKSTLAATLSRALEPAPGTVLVGGRDVTATSIEDLRRRVGVVTQHTEVFAATLADNITLFTGVSAARIGRAVEELGLTGWVAGLPDGLHTVLGPGATTLSAGEEQLIAFARVLVRDVAVVVLDEATARMDPVTERRVARAADRLLAGRTGIVVAHRTATIQRCDSVAVLDRGRLVQSGPRAALASAPGPFCDLLAAAGDATAPVHHPADAADLRRASGSADSGTPAAVRASLSRTVVRVMLKHRRWGLTGDLVWLAGTLLGVAGVVTGWAWGRLVEALDRGASPWPAVAALTAGVLLSPMALAYAARTHPRWYAAVTAQLRLAVLAGQTGQRRLPRTASGEVVSRALDSDRLTGYTDRWIGVVYGVLVVAATAVAGGAWLPGLVAGGVLVLAAALAVLGAPLAGAAARTAGDARVAFGAFLGSALSGVRTLKLAAATPAVLAHLDRVDSRRVTASLRENRVRALLGGVSAAVVQSGVLTGWALYVSGTWTVATTLLVTTAVSGFGWFSHVAAAAVTEAPIARRWLGAAADLAGTPDMVTPPPGVDLVRGTAPAPAPAPRVPLSRLRLAGVSAVHDDGTVGVEGVDLTLEAGELVLVLGRVGAGKSSLLATLAGLVRHEGDILWNDRPVGDPELFLRPGQVAYVAQVPRVLSGSFTENTTLDHDRRWAEAVADAQLTPDVTDAGGPAAEVGHRGLRLSGGQIQRLALARALATEAELVLADDISSALDARTEIEVWSALRRRGATVLATGSRRAALAAADRVAVLDDRRLVAVGTWVDLQPSWGHLAS